MAVDPGHFRRLLQSFFCQHLTVERNVSDKTVASYRDVFRLFTRFWKGRNGSGADFAFSDFAAPLIIDFLHHLEAERHNSPSTRNHRLAGIRSFAEYVAMAEPRFAGQMQSILSIPPKRHDTKMVPFLDREEVEAILDAPPDSTWSGRRDRILFRALYNSGARITEMVSLRVHDLELKRQPSVKLHGKGRKERVIPLWKNTASALRAWIKENRLNADDPVFANTDGVALSRSGAEKRLSLAVRTAATSLPSLKRKRVSPHVVRHTTAMHMLQSGVDITLIALWLGHASTNTTHGYLEADLAMKEKTLASVRAPKNRTVRFRPSNDLLSFLDAL